MEHYKKHGEIPTLGFTPDADFPVIYGEKGGLHVDLLGEIDNSVIEEIHAGEALNIVIGKADMQVHNWKEEYAALFDFYLQCYDLKGCLLYTSFGYKVDSHVFIFTIITKQCSCKFTF